MIARRAFLSLPLLFGVAPHVRPRRRRTVDTFVSAPDFYNADYGDCRGLGNWSPGMPNSINDKWRRATDVCMDEVEAENPRAVWVAGDLVEGHWDIDTDNDQMFGPVGTLAEKRAAVRKAAGVYYPHWKAEFERRSLPVYPALGDHEIGDDRLASQPVDERWPAGSDRLDLVPTYKEEFAAAFPMTGADHPTGGAAGTAYAKQFPNLLLVTVDMFTVLTDGVRMGVEFGQLNWLDGVLAANTLPNVVVQGHVPVLTPVRKKYSGGLNVSTGAQSPFWQCLKDHNVPLFLCGEVHAITAVAPPNAPVQVSHGSLFHRGFNYLRIDAHDDGVLQLTSKEVVQTEFDDTQKLWGCAADKRPARNITYARGANTIGAMTIDNGTVTARSGSLDVATELGWTH